MLYCIFAFKNVYMATGIQPQGIIDGYVPNLSMYRHPWCSGRGSVGGGRGRGDWQPGTLQPHSPRQAGGDGAFRILQVYRSIIIIILIPILIILFFSSSSCLPQV